MKIPFAKFGFPTILLLLSICVGWKGTSASQNQMSTSAKLPRSLQWGPIDHGLQMTAWFDKGESSAYCAIRNSEKQPVRYCVFDIGYFEDVFVYARHSATEQWILIKCNGNGSICGMYSSVGPVADHGETIDGGKIITKSKCHRDRSWAIRYIPDKNKPEHTYEVWLKAYQFPKEWSGKIECKIVQDMCVVGPSGWVDGSRKLETPGFTVSLPLKPSKS